MPKAIGRSRPVATARTPGSLSAREVSIDTIRACARRLRSSLQWSIRGRTMSSANFVWPVTFAAASTFAYGRPTTRVLCRTED